MSGIRRRARRSVCPRGRLTARYPRVFHLERHAFQFAPASTMHRFFRP